MIVHGFADTLPGSYANRKYMVCMVSDIIKWREVDMSPMRDGRDDKQGKIELLSLWTVGRLSFAIKNNKKSKLKERVTAGWTNERGGQHNDKKWFISSGTTRFRWA